MARSANLEELHDPIDERVAARMRAAHWPGVALGIELEGATHLRAYGLANLEHGVPVRADTVFRIGSLTKQFTAALVLKLQEQDHGRSDWSEARRRHHCCAREGPRPPRRSGGLASSTS